MTTSPNLGLTLTPSTEATKNFLNWRTEMAGDSVDSNMMILDTEVGTIKNNMPTTTSDLTNDSSFVADASYVHTDANYTTTEKTKLSGIATGANNYTHPSTHTADIIVDGTTNKAYTATEKTKLASVATNANNYSLPNASSTMLGGIKVGSNLTITNGVLSAVTGTYTLPNATTSTLGGVVVGNGLSVSNGTLSVTIPTTNDYTITEKTKLAGLSAYSPMAEIAVSTTLALYHAQYFIKCTNASAITITIPLNSNVSFPVGTELEIARYGAGTVNIAATSGVALNSKNNYRYISYQYSSATLKKIATDEWLLIGDLFVS